jgi:hypothetical protein
MQPEVKDAVFVWLTPLFNNEVFRQQIMAKKHHGLFVIGSRDPHHDRAKLAEVETLTDRESLVFDLADRSLELAGKTLLVLGNPPNLRSNLQNWLQTI